MVAMRDIRSFANEIAHRFHPDQIILFGSHAYGAATSDSDVDLLVVMRCGRRTTEKEIQIRQALSAPFPLDLLVHTPADLARFHDVVRAMAGK